MSASPINHSTYDTLYLAFSIAMGASALVTADEAFLRSIRSHPDPNLSAMALSLDAWARSRASEG
jgi:predicted nucleic acid-binding protein